MENASKALMIAGGVLIAMMMIGLIIFARTQLSDYQETQEQVKKNEQTTEFNQQFEAYNKKIVEGYQLISLTNLVEDYNSRATYDTGYEKITLTIKWYGYNDNRMTNLTPIQLTDITSLIANKAENTLKRRKEFNEKYFTCKNVEYDNSTGRVKAMSFEEITKKQ